MTPSTAALYNPWTGELEDDLPVPGELVAGEPGTLHYRGRVYRTERVAIDDLDDWPEANGLRRAAHQPPALLAGIWPPAVLYEPEKEETPCSTE